MPTNGSSKRRLRRLGCGGYLLMAFGIPTLVLFVAALIWLNRCSSQFEAKLAEIRAAAEPCTLKELESYYGFNAEELETARLWLSGIELLATEEFRQAAENLPLVGDTEEKIPPPGQPWPGLAAAEGFLREYGHALKQLHDAAERCVPARYPIDIIGDKEDALALEPVPESRAAVRLLQLEAHVRAHRGDPEGAAAAIQTLFEFGESFRGKPTALSQALRTGVGNRAQETLHALLPHAGFSNEHLQQLQVRLRDIDLQAGLHRAMIGERVMGIMNVEAIAELSVLNREFPIEYLERMDRYIAASQRPITQALDLVTQINNDLDQASRNPLSKQLDAVATLLALANSTVFEAVACGIASRDAVDARIAIELFRRKNGRVPESLEELVPDFIPRIPPDPFDALPLRYKVQEDGFMIYSVGRNRVDDGGQSEGDENRQPDLVFPGP